jgi:hypothetical protein
MPLWAYRKKAFHTASNAASCQRDYCGCAFVLVVVNDALGELWASLHWRLKPFVSREIRIKMESDAVDGKYHRCLG